MIYNTMTILTKILLVNLFIYQNTNFLFKNMYTNKYLQKIKLIHIFYAVLAKSIVKVITTLLEKLIIYDVK